VQHRREGVSSAGMTDNNVIEEIRVRLDIVDVISDYTDLKKAGSNYKALCPFHSEKTPSFMVSPQKQIFHCFGCGAGGDIFSFIMKYENVSFPEALRTLAQRAGVELRQSRKYRGRDTDDLYRIHAEATEFYLSNLAGHRGAQEYLEQRGLSKEVIGMFRLGYSPSQSQALYRLLKDNGYPDHLIEKSGLVKFPEKGSPYDMFRGRIMFPITDVNNRVVAFGARALDVKPRSSVPKYINSPETPIFRKGLLLYGLDVAHKNIRQKGYAMVMEGYMDVIVCHQYGFTNAVAPLGTALTEGQMKKLRAYAKKVLLVFDGDDAGLRAARRSLPIIYATGMQAKVMFLPEGYDPDSFLREKGPEEFRKLFPHAKGLVDFYLGLGGDRVEIIRELIEVVAGIRDGILRGQIVNDIATKTSIPDVYLVEEIQKHLKRSKAPLTTAKRNQPLLPEEVLLAIAFARPEYAREIIPRLSENDIEKNIVKNIFLKVKKFGGIPALNSMNGLFDEEEISHITALTIRTGFDEDKVEDIIRDCIRKLKSRRLHKDMSDLELNIKIADASGDVATLNDLLSRKQKLLQEARSEGIL